MQVAGPSACPAAGVPEGSGSSFGSSSPRRPHEPNGSIRSGVGSIGHYGAMAEGGTRRDDGKVSGPAFQSILSRQLAPTIAAITKDLQTPTFASIMSRQLAPTIAAITKDLQTPTLASIMSRQLAPTIAAITKDLQTPTLASIMSRQLAPTIAAITKDL